MRLRKIIFGQQPRVFPALPRMDILSAHYPMDETTGNVLYDVFNQDEITLSSYTVGVEGKKNTGIQSASKTSVGTMPTYDSPELTVSLWFRFDGTNGNWSTLLCRAGGSYHHLLIENGTYRIGFYNATFRTSGTTLVIGNWYHIVITKTTTTQSIYINGELDYSYASFNNSTYPLSVLGNYTNTGNQGVIGIMDELSIWHGILSDQEIADLYNDGEGVFWKKPDRYSFAPITSLALLQAQGFSMKMAVQEPHTSSHPQRGYNVYVDGVYRSGLHGDPSDIVVTGLEPDTVYNITVTVVDIYGYESEQSNVVTANSGVINLPDPVAYYKLDETSGNLAYDSMGNYHGNITLATKNEEGIVNTGYKFTRAQQSLINIGGSIPILNDSTISFWMKHDGGGGRMCPMQYHTYSTWGTINLENDFKLRPYYQQQTGGYSTIQSQTILTPNTWYHIAYVKDHTNGFYRIYINGELDVEKDVSATNSAAVTPNGDFFIADGYAGNFYGGLDEFGIWDIALHDDQIRLLYNGGSGTTYPAFIPPQPSGTLPSDQLVAYYKMDEAVGQSELRNHVNGEFAKLYGTPTLSQPGVVGQSVEFNHNDTYADDSFSILSGNESHSIAAWIKINAAATTREGILTLAPQTTGGHHWLLNSTSIAFGRWSGTATSFPTSDITYGEWFHVVTTFDKDSRSFKVYLNGQMHRSLTFATNQTFNFYNGVLLGRCVTGEREFNGSLDEVGVWKKELSWQEVVDVYNNGNGITMPAYDYTTTPITTDLISEYTFKETSGDLIDQYGSYNGTINGGVVRGEVGKFGNCYYFNGTNSYISFPSFQSVTEGDITLEVWAKNDLATNACLFSQNIKTTWANNLWIFYLGDGSNESRLWWHGASSYSYLGAGSGDKADFDHYVYWKKGTVNRLYKNGAEVIQGTANTGMWVSDTMVLGCALNNTTYTQFYKGHISLLRLWKRALDPNYIFDLYNNGAGVESIQTL